jgi:HicA-like toxin of HicAB toxin-antitoxin system
MSPIHALSVRDALSLLILYRIDHNLRERGDHTRYRHRDGRTTTLPEHEGRPISPTLVRLIAADLEMSVGDFLSQL